MHLLTQRAGKPGSSLAYAFGPTFQWTLFSGGRIRNSIKVEEARTEQALQGYEQTVLLALEDTEKVIRRKEVWESHC